MNEVPSRCSSAQDDGFAAHYPDFLFTSAGTSLEMVTFDGGLIDMTGATSLSGEIVSTGKAVFVETRRKLPVLST
ncbi:MAG: hypothetical protein MJY92_01495 [Bacteroidales bacterium]|nr:hypothetical protein [Bacteroidales bacterium]